MNGFGKAEARDLARPLKRLACLALLAACARGSANSEFAATKVEVVGRIIEIGVGPGAGLLVEVNGEQLRLTGRPLETMKSVKGATMWLRGMRSTTVFAVSDFEVRTVNGRPVDDGVLFKDIGNKGGYWMRLRSGTMRAIARPDERMKGLIGARVWATREQPGEMPNFGVIKR